MASSKFLRHWLSIVWGILLFALNWTVIIAADPIINEDAWITNGYVYEVAYDGEDTVYVAGDFSYAGPVTGLGAALDAESGHPNLDLPIIYGEYGSKINTVVSDESGGWYIGGKFSQVGTESRINLAHILSDNTIDPVFNPNPSGDEWSEIYSLTIVGDTLYVGGKFDSIGGETRANLAALDATTGLATDWNPDPDGWVFIIVAEGNEIYVGGAFFTIGGETRSGIAELDATTGLATDWNSDISGYVYDLALTEDVIYVVGNIGVQTDEQDIYGIIALDATTGLAVDWNPDPEFAGWEWEWEIFGVEISNNTLYVVGAFNSIGGELRNGLAAIDTTTGLATDWNPDADGWVDSIFLTDSTLYVGGNFSSIGGEVRHNIAAFDIMTGQATDWNPNADDRVLSFAQHDSTIFSGGAFESIGGEVRHNLAAFDATTGQITDWNPNADDRIGPIAISGNLIYATGAFTSIGGQSRNGLAAIDATTGLATDWNPDPDGTWCSTIAYSDNIVYVEGNFTSIGGQSRNLLAALDATTGLATDWNPDPDNQIHTMQIVDNLVYVGGYQFSSIGGQWRNRLAALDATTGLATDWNPDAGSTVWDLLVKDNLVYIAGEFRTIGGESRVGLAAVDVTTGLATPWNPIPYDRYVFAIDASKHSLYVGGEFDEIDGQLRRGVAFFHLDIAPTLVLTTVPAELITDTTPTFAGTATDTINAVSSVEFQVDGTDGDWITCTANDGAFDELEESFSCTVVTPLNTGTHTIYFRAIDNDGNVTDSGSESSYSFTIKKEVSDEPQVSTPLDTTPPLRSFTLVGENGQKYSREFKQMSLLNQEVVGYNHYPQFCFSAAHDEDGKLKSYLIKVNGQDYLTGIRPTPPPVGDEGNTRVESSGATIKESNEKWIKWEGFTKIEDVDRICVYGKGDAKYLSTGLHTWEVIAKDEAGNQTIIGTARFLVGTHTGSKGKESGLFYPLSILQIGNRTNLTYSTENPELFTSVTQPLVVVDTTPTIYGIASVGSQITLIVDKEVINATGDKQREQVENKNTTANTNSEWGINLIEPLTTGTYYLTVEATDVYDHYAIIKDVLITVGQSAANSTISSQVLGDATKIDETISKATVKDEVTELTHDHNPTPSMIPQNTPPPSTEPQTTEKSQQSFFDKLAAWILNLIR